MQNDILKNELPPKNARNGADEPTSHPDSRGLVSVIIPGFNVRPYLIEALDSVVFQTYTNLEIIIIDDGSTDGSGKICDEYAEKDARVHVIHQENKGLSTARNVGLDRMTGEAVVFLDPDDAYRPDYVKAMMEAMIREGADQVICRYTVHHTTKKMRHTGKEHAGPLIEPGLHDRVHAMRAIADGTINYSVWNKLYRRKLWNTLRFLDGHVYEDGEASFKATSLSQRVYVLDTPLYLKRNRAGNITGTVSWENISDYLLTRDRIDSFMAAYTPAVFSEKQRKKMMQSRINGMIVFYIRLRSRETAELKFLSETLRNKIVHAVKEIGPESLEFRAKMAYGMLLHCPWLLKIVYPVYRPVRLFARRVMGC